MKKVKVVTYHKRSLDNAIDIYKYCAEGDLEKVSNLIHQGENIYQRSVDYCTIVPLFVAICERKDKVVNILLDIYERDLNFLNITHSKKALIAMSDDQTEEFIKTVETEPSDDVIPVLLKSCKSEILKCVYLRKKLKDRNDLSIKLARKLEKKNGTCDLNFQVMFGDQPEDSFLHLAIYYEMKSILKRLLNQPSIDTKIINMSEQNPLHYAMSIGNLDIINLLLSKSDYGNFYEDRSYLYHAILSGNQKCIDMVLNKLFDCGVTMKEILKMTFSFDRWIYHYYNNDEDVIVVDNLLHLVARDGNFQNFLQVRKKFMEEEDFYLQNSKGETILHLLLLNSFHKLNVKINLITTICKSFPKLLTVKNHKRQLPLHLSLTYDTPGQRLFLHLLKLTIEESQNPEIFYEDSEMALSTLERAIKVNKGLSSEYLSHFEKLLRSHGTRLLHKTIKADQKLKKIEGILSSPTRVNLNDFYDGTNGYLSLLRYDINLDFYQLRCAKPHKYIIESLQKLINRQPIEDINARDTTGTTLFMYIVGFCEDNEFIKSWINAGADCKAVNFANFTCLHLGASNIKNKEIVQILLDKGVDPNVISTSEKLPVHVAIQSQNVHAFETLAPFLSDDDLQKKFGTDNSTLIQYWARCWMESVFESVWKLYKSRNIRIDVNDTNVYGDNLPSIAAGSHNLQHLDLIFSNSFEEINFNIKNKRNETFIHKLAYCQNMMKCLELLEKYSGLQKVINDQMNLINDDGLTAMDMLTDICQYEDYVDEEYVNFFIKHLTEENLKKNFQMFVRSSFMVQKLTENFPQILDNLDPKTCYKILEEGAFESITFDFLMSKYADKLWDAKSDDDNNILHLFCHKNDPEFIDIAIKTLSETKLKELSEELNKDHTIPFKLLNDENSFAFEKVFTFQL